MVTRRALLIVAALVVAGCGTDPGTPPPTGGAPTAAAGACTFAADVADLDAVRAQADLVIRGRVHKPPLVRGEGGAATTYFAIDVETTVQARVEVPDPVYVSVAGPPSPLIFPDDDYVMFLYSLFPKGGKDANVGVPTFEPSLGLLGLFPVRDGRVYRECSDRTTPRRVPATGEGQGQPVDELVAKVRARPWPTATVVPKPTRS